MAWIELHQSLPGHRKTLRLMGRLKLRRGQAVGHLCLLWLWALDNVKDGDLSGVTARELAQVADFNPRRGDELVDALVEAGFLDREGERLRIHDWEDYGGKLEQMRTRKKLNMRRCREKQDLCGDHVAETCRHVSDIHNITQENQTEQNNTEDKKTNSLFAGDGGAQAGGRAESEAEDAVALTRDYLMGRGLLPEAWLGSEPEMVAECRALGDALFHSFADRPATEADQARVFQGVMRQWQDKEGDMHCSIDEDRRDLLHYAFEQATLAGKPGNWPYIQGVLLRLHQRGITDLRGAEMYELEREGL